MLIFDIETYHREDEQYLNYRMGNFKAPSTWKDPDKIANNIAEQKVKAKSKMALSAMTGKITLIGMLQESTPAQCESTPLGGMHLIQLGMTDERSEEDMLLIFWNLVKAALLSGEKIVSYNGKKFDLPYAFQRSVILGIGMSIPVNIDRLLYKYSNENHVDLFQVMGEEGGLVDWSYLTGSTDSLEKDGLKILSWYAKGEYAKIKDKNTIDLFQTYELYKRVIRWI